MHDIKQQPPLSLVLCPGSKSAPSGSTCLISNFQTPVFLLFSSKAQYLIFLFLPTKVSQRPLSVFLVKICIYLVCQFRVSSPHLELLLCKTWEIRFIFALSCFQASLLLKRSCLCLQAYTAVYKTGCCVKIPFLPSLDDCSTQLAQEHTFIKDGRFYVRNQK